MFIGLYAPSARQPEWPWPGRSIANAGRPRPRATVSQVCAFCAPPWTSTTSGAELTPAQGADLTWAVVIGGHHGVDPLDHRQLGDVERELGDVLVEEAELVVVDHGVHVGTSRSS